MTRALCVALLLALALPVSAKTLIVADVPYVGVDLGNGAEDTFESAEASRWCRVKLLTDIFDLTGSSYVVIPPNAMRTEWARTGVVTWDFGKSNARTETFDAVIHATFVRRSAASNRRYSFYRPDSLSTVTVAPLVPQLFLESHANGGDINVALDVASTATSCSLGVADDGFITAGSGNIADHDEESVTFDIHSADRWAALRNNGQDSILVASIVGKGFRRLIGHGKGPMASSWQSSQVYPGDVDSTIVANAPGQASVFMVQNTHKSGAKPIIVAHISDGLGGVTSGEPTWEDGDRTLLWPALAALDSAAGGQVFDNEAKLPVQVAITVDGLCSRSTDLNSGGIVPADTTQFYATMDSIATYGIPVTFAVNLDSVAAYPRDLQYAKDNVRTARFSPQSRAGLDTAVAFAPEGGITHRYRAVDTFGRYRNQARAYGPTGGAAGDTSLFAKLRYAIVLGDSMWGANRSSRFALPPDDDWSPYNLRGWQVDASRGVLVDSILYAYAKAGFRGIRINGAWTASVRPHMNPTNPIGFVWDQGRYATADRSLKINLVAHNGATTYGHRPLNWSAQVDSTIPIASDPSPTVQWYATYRFWSGISGPGLTRYAAGAANFYSAAESDQNSTGDAGRARILKLSCQELAGKAHSATMTKAQATRPGWWSIRRVAMPIRTINRLAGRTIISLGYPEDVSLK